MVAFGIRISSRDNKAWEIIEMLNFAEMAARLHVNENVISVFYDTRASICNFELDPQIRLYYTEAEKILEAARKTITQFMWGDSIELGEPADEMMEPCEEP